MADPDEPDVAERATADTAAAPDARMAGAAQRGLAAVSHGERAQRLRAALAEELEQAGGLELTRLAELDPWPETDTSDVPMSVAPALRDPFGRMAREVSAPPFDEAARGTRRRGTQQPLSSFPEFAVGQQESSVTTIGVDEPGRLAALERAFRILLPLQSTPGVLAAAREKHTQLVTSRDPAAQQALAQSLLAAHAQLERRIKEAPPGDDGLPAVPDLPWPAGTAAGTASSERIHPFGNVDVWRAVLQQSKPSKRSRRAEPVAPHEPPPPRLMPLPSSGGIEKPSSEQTGQAPNRSTRHLVLPPLPTTVDGCLDALRRVTVGQVLTAHGLQPNTLDTDEAKLAGARLTTGTGALLYIGPGFAAAFDPDNGLVLDTPLGACFAIEGLSPHPEGIYWTPPGLGTARSVSLGQGRIEPAPGFFVWFREQGTQLQDRLAFDAWLQDLREARLGIATVVSAGYWHRRSAAAVAREFGRVALQGGVRVAIPGSRAAAATGYGRLEKVAARSLRYIPAEAVAGLERLANLTVADVLRQVWRAIETAIPGYGQFARGKAIGEQTLRIARIAGLAVHGGRKPDGDIDAAARLLARELVVLAGGSLARRGVRAATAVAARTGRRVLDATRPAAGTQQAGGPAGTGAPMQGRGGAAPPEAATAGKPQPDAGPGSVTQPRPERRRRGPRKRMSRDYRHLSDREVWRLRGDKRGMEIERRLGETTYKSYSKSEPQNLPVVDYMSAGNGHAVSIKTVDPMSRAYRSGDWYYGKSGKRPRSMLEHVDELVERTPPGARVTLDVRVPPGTPPLVRLEIRETLRGHASDPRLEIEVRTFP